jgi:peptide/nickel transport system substrate-binding protein
VTATVLATVTVATTVGCFVEPPATDDSGARRLRVGLAFVPKGRMSPYTDDAPIITLVGAAGTLVNADPAGTLRHRIGSRHVAHPSALWAPIPPP